MPRIQFSMWWLMVAITVICVLLFLMNSVGDLVGTIWISIVWCILPTPLVALAIYGRGDWQAFAIGGLVPWGSAIIYSEDLSFNSIFGALVWLPVMCLVCGSIAAVTRRWIITNLRDQ